MWRLVATLADRRLLLLLFERASERLQTITWRDAGRMLGSVLAFPFWLLGYLAGLIVVLVLLMWAAVLVGFGDARGAR